MASNGTSCEDDEGPPPGFEGILPQQDAATRSDTIDDRAPAGPPAAATGKAEDGKAEDDNADALADKLQRAVKVDEPAEANGHDAEDAVPRETGLREQHDTQITTRSDTIYTSATTFEHLPALTPEILKGLYVEMKFERPSKVQAITLPMILTPPYRDLIAQAQNGSGKTTCFVLCMLSRVNPDLPEPQALCLCPTRELVVQNLSVLKRIGKYTRVQATSTASEVEGASFRREPVTEQVVIGAHGKLKAWVNKRILRLDHIVVLVFDEADEMLKVDGFADDSVRLIKSIQRKNPRVQLLLFSATFNNTIRAFAMQIAPNANHIFVAKEELSLDVISQYNVRCPNPDAKVRVLKEMIFPNCEKLGQTIIFVRSREVAKELHNAMEADGYKCTCIQGGMDHADRDRVVKEFRDGITKILISTDVLARGFDVSQVTLVVNFDVPVERDGRTPQYETYLHRIGRSGRFGRKGAAFNLMCGPEDAHVMSAISHYFNKEIVDVQWDDEEQFTRVLQASM